MIWLVARRNLPGLAAVLRQILNRRAGGRGADLVMPHRRSGDANPTRGKSSQDTGNSRVFADPAELHEMLRYRVARYARTCVSWSGSWSIVQPLSTVPPRKFEGSHI